MSKVYIPVGPKVVGRQQSVRLREQASVEALLSVSDVFRETLVQVRVDKFHHEVLARAGLLLPNGKTPNTDLAFLEKHGVIPYEVRWGEPHNLLMFGGASNLWQCLIGNGTATTAQTLTFFNNAEANLGTGNSTTAAAATQTDLQGASKNRQGQEATFPSHTDGEGAAGPEDIIFKSQWASGDGNYAWEEWGLFNRATTAGRMLNRKVESLGTKVSGAVWNLTVTLTLA